MHRPAAPVAAEIACSGSAEHSSSSTYLDYVKSVPFSIAAEASSQPRRHSHSPRLILTTPSSRFHNNFHSALPRKLSLDHAGFPIAQGPLPALLIPSPEPHTYTHHPHPKQGPTTAQHTRTSASPPHTTSHVPRSSPASQGARSGGPGGWGLIEFLSPSRTVPHPALKKKRDGGESRWDRETGPCRRA